MSWHVLSKDHSVNVIKLMTKTFFFREICDIMFKRS